jgi:hypothetical protein
LRTIKKSRKGRVLLGPEDHRVIVGRAEATGDTGVCLIAVGLIETVGTTGLALAPIVPIGFTAAAYRGAMLAVGYTDAVGL